MAENHEIFDNARVTELALKWKALTKENKHGEAMPVLEEIIRLCEHMFLRLAQYEGFTNTVDLSTLVQSAREKVPRWLIGWDPTYKSNNGIFSWFSKCCASTTCVTLADGSKRQIGEIVDNQLSLDVVVRDPVTGRLSTAKITDWHRKLADRSEWRKVSVGARGSAKKYYRTLFLTNDHPLWSADAGAWVDAQDIKVNERVLIKGSNVTDYGKAVLVGTVLGDAHVSKQKGAVCLGHGGKQLWYTGAIAEMFNKVSSERGTTNQTKKIYRMAQTCIPTMEIWPEANANLHRGVKRINDWLLSHITDVSLAFWYMDDGSLCGTRGSGVTERPQLHTESFTLDECGRLQQILLDRFNVKTELVPRKQGPYSYIKVLKESVDTFCALVAPWMFKEMEYKLPVRFQAGGNTLPAVEEALVVTQVLINQLVYPTPNRRAGNICQCPDLTYKYDITVDGAGNFIANDILTHNCSKHAFLSEIAKLNQHRKRFHATGDNLEKFFGAEDHNAFKEEAASDVRRKLADITVRWGDPQEIGAVRYILECLVEDRDADSKPDKEVVIRAASYAWCVSPELTRFFYDWALFALRDALHHKIHVPFTQQDLLRNRESYTFLVDMIDIVGWDRFKRLIVTLGGQRLRLPTLQQLARLHADYLMSQEIDKSDLDPDSVEQVGKKHGRSAKAAAEIYAEMVEITNPRRSGEHSLYPDPSEEHHESDN